MENQNKETIQPDFDTNKENEFSTKNESPNNELQETEINSQPSSYSIIQENTEENITKKEEEGKEEKKKKEDMSLQTPVEKKKKRLNKILFASIILVLLSIIFMLFLNLLSSFSQSNQLPTTKEKFTKGEEITVEKAKEIVEKANEKMEDIEITKEDEKEIFKTQLPSLPVEEEQQENSNQPQHFSNSELGISFTYPSDWIEIFSFQGKETPENIKNVVMVGYPPDSNIIDNMRISIEGTPLSITAKEYFAQTEEVMQKVFPKFQLVNKGEITVSGREAPTRTYLWVPQEELDRTPYEQEWLRIKQYQVYVAGRNKVYVITFTGEEKTFDKNLKKYQEILSTLELGD